MSEPAELDIGTGESPDDDDYFEINARDEPWDDGELFDNSLNCHGVVHVRVLCAQRLPCPVGSSVCATVSLMPWRGRIRTQRTSSFLLSYENGVCVRWDQSTNSGLCSMVHAWSSEDSPTPKIACDLMFSPLGVGLLDFKMCSFEVSCDVLMKKPGVWKSHWFSDIEANANGESTTDACLDENTPTLKLAALFAPTHPGPRKSLPSTPSRQAQNTGNDADDDNNNNNTNNRHEIVQSADTLLPTTCPTTSPCSSVSHVEVISSTEPVNPDEKLLPDSSTDPHLLRVQSSWMPIHCYVCSSIILGRNQMFICERCSIKCCSDCRLHVDLRLPCGSNESKAAVENASRKKISVDNILSVVAPDEVFNQERKASSHSSAPASATKSADHTHDSSFQELDYIGCLRLEFTAACLFQHPLSAFADPRIALSEIVQREVRTGDYYARISIQGSGATARTRTLQNTGLPKFEANEMKFNVKHYGEEFRFEVIDATTDTVIGASYLTAHGLILDQKDELLGELGPSLFQFPRGVLTWKGKRSMKLLLRQSSKGTVSLDSRIIHSSNDKGSDTGSITGWLEVRIGLEEASEKLHFMECPDRPTPDLNLATFQTHLLRMQQLLLDLNRVANTYNYLVSWKDPFVTGLCFVIFTMLCVCFDFEYIGCLPFFGPLILLAYSSHTRDVHGLKKRFLGSGFEMFNKVGQMYAPTLSLANFHRPIGTVEITVYRGSRLCSRDLGIPGKSLCRVIWDPLRFADEKLKRVIIEYDKSAESQHEIGSTDARFGADPVWDEIFEGDETKRLMHFLPWEGDFFESFERKRRALRFPVLQPFTLKSKATDSLNRFVDCQLKPWRSSPAAIVLRIKFQDFLNNLPGSDHILGEVVFPFEKVVGVGEVSGWFEVLNAGSNAVSTCRSDDEMSQKASQERDLPTGPPRIFASLKWLAPPSEDGQRAAESERVASQALQEELVRFATLTKSRKTDLLGSSIGAVNTALGMGGTLQLIQNYLGTVVDFMEIVSNAMNFTDPFISSAIFFFVLLLVAIFICVKTRYIVLSVGLVQFGASFLSRYGGHLVHSSSQNYRDVPTKLSNARQQTNYSLWAKNVFRSLPTREDLWKIYSWESKRQMSHAQEKHASLTRNTRLGRLWKASWSSPIEIRITNVGTRGESRGYWEPAFAVMKGHRFLWWNSVDSFDDGEVPSGMIYFSGHSGLTGPSPVESMEFPSNEAPLVVGVFGRGSSGQERVLALLPDSATKEVLEAAVAGLATKDD